MLPVIAFNCGIRDNHPSNARNINTPVKQDGTGLVVNIRVKGRERHYFFPDTGCSGVIASDFLSRCGALTAASRFSLALRYVRNTSTNL